MRKSSFTIFGGVAVATLAVASVAYSQATNRRGADANRDGIVTSAEAAAAAQARFARADANNDGRLTVADREAGRTRASAEMFSRIDADGDGSITRAEWDAHGAAMRARMTERRSRRGADEQGRRAGMRGEHLGRHGGQGRAMRMLQSVDSNGDQAIDREEFLAASARRFSAADANGDGVLTAAERDADRVQMRQRFREEMLIRRDNRQAGENATPADPAE